MEFPALRANLTRVREEIARVQQREGLQGEVRIVAVTKGHPPAAARAARAAGLTDIGENRVQEALPKLDALAALALRWHLVGHLQTNKVKLVPGRFAMVQSVDSIKVVDAMHRAVEQWHAAARAGGAATVPVPLEVLVQVNVAGEAQKFGCSPEDAAAVAQRVVAAAPALVLRGLMTLAPFTDDEGVQRAAFGGLRRLRDRLMGGGLSLLELSMGMSNDYRAAVAEGATMLRLGTVLFGERPT